MATYHEFSHVTKSNDLVVPLGGLLKKMNDMNMECANLVCKCLFAI